MLGRQLYLGVAALFATAGPSSAQCDLSSIVAAAQSQMASGSFEAIVAISSERIALVTSPETPQERLNVGRVPLLELRDDTAVEVGSAELLWSSGLLDRFGEVTGGADLELVIGKSQSVLLGDEECIGVDWQATSMSSSYYALEGAELETRFTAGQVYSAVLSGRDLRDEVMPTVLLDLRRGERLSERLTELPKIQSSVVVRPFLGPLSIYEVHIPTFALRTPSETWLSDEISYLSRIEAEEWRLGRALPEFSLKHDGDSAVSAGAYFPISDVWSGEVQFSSDAGEQTHYAIERAYLWPSYEIYGSVNVGHLEAIGYGASFSGMRDFGQSQIGVSLGVGQDSERAAALFERSFGINTEAWAFIDAQSAEWNFALGVNHRPNPSMEVDFSLLRDIDDNQTEIRVGLSFLMRGARPSRVEMIVGDEPHDLTALRRNSSTLRSARRDALDASWSEVLD
jgi:hypothetical protein